ncbi:MAG TPA: hypothetical protein VKV32_03755 [Stellaceae bacterium]|nr:hypothetical protein [Stellaceae bacterium]
MTDSDRNERIVVNNETHFEASDMRVTAVAAIAAGVLLYVTLVPLFGERVQLDPYLVVTYGEARLLVGIWDGDKIFLCA